MSIDEAGGKQAKRAVFKSRLIGRFRLFRLFRVRELAGWGNSAFVQYSFLHHRRRHGSGGERQASAPRVAGAQKLSCADLRSTEAAVQTPSPPKRAQCRVAAEPALATTLRRRSLLSSPSCRSSSAWARVPLRAQAARRGSGGPAATAVLEPERTLARS